MLSIIICSVEETRYRHICAEYERVLKNTPHEIIRIDDAKGMAEGYNRGARLAKHDLLVFSHDDIEIMEDDFGAKLLSRLGKYDLIGTVGSTRLTGPSWNFAHPPYLYGQIAHRMENGMLRVDMYNNTHRVFAGMKIIDGVFMATRRRVVEKVPFDQVLFDRFHLYDLDFSFRAHQAGFNIATCCDLGILHYSLGNYDDEWEVYAKRFMEKFKGRFVETPRIPAQWSAVLVSTREEAKSRMNHELWETFAG